MKNQKLKEELNKLQKSEKMIALKDKDLIQLKGGKTQSERDNVNSSGFCIINVCGFNFQ